MYAFMYMCMYKNESIGTNFLSFMTVMHDFYTIHILSKLQKCNQHYWTMDKCFIIIIIIIFIILNFMNFHI
jgi:hypothetical protein